MAGNIEIAAYISKMPVIYVSVHYADIAISIVHGVVTENNVIGLEAYRSAPHSVLCVQTCDAERAGSGNFSGKVNVAQVARNPYSAIACSIDVAHETSAKILQEFKACVVSIYG